MFQIADYETFQDGQLIIKQGSLEPDIYTIKSGSVALCKQTEDGEIRLEVLYPGDIFGESVFLAKRPQTVSAKAVGTTTVGIIDDRALNQEYDRLSMDFQFILKSLSTRLDNIVESSAAPKLRREQPRVPIPMALIFKSGTALKNAFSGDVSTTGMFIKTDQPLPKGQEFMLKLQLPGSLDALNIGCNVVWNRTQKEDPSGRQVGMGIRFADISPEDRQRLREAIYTYKAV